MRRQSRNWRVKETANGEGENVIAGGTELPDSYEDAVEEMIEGVKMARRRGVRRMRIVFDTKGGDETFTTLKASLDMVGSTGVGEM